MKLKTLLQEFVSLDSVTSYEEIRGITDIIDVTGDVDLNEKLPKGTKELGVTFGRVEDSFNIAGNKDIPSLKGCPKYVGRYFSCSKSAITSFEFAPKYVGTDFYSSYLTNKISLVGIHKHIQHIGTMFWISGTTITEGGLGLLWIDGLKALDCDNSNFKPAADIINKYLALSDGKDAWKYIEHCRDELENAGLHEFAKE